MFRRHNLTRVVLTGLLLSLSACSPAADRNAIATLSRAAGAPTLAPALTATTLPTPSVVPPISTVQATALPRPSDQDLARLKTLIAGQRPADQAVSPDQSFGVGVLPLTTTTGLSPLYAVYTAFPSGGVGPDARQALEIYAFVAGQWQKRQTIKLDQADYLNDNGVRQVTLEPNHIWLEVQSGAGAHSGCYDLIGIDFSGQALAQRVTHCNSSPGAGELADVNGDGQLDVVLDQSDYYVFCYACGVNHPQYRVLAWDGAQLSEVSLATVFDTSPAELQQLNNEAVQLARAGLWKDAQTAIDQATALKADNSVVRWNAALIARQVEAQQAQVRAQTYPLLNQLFYGDYQAALNILRPYSPAELFRVDTPIISGTVADGWTEQLATWITDSTNTALQARPDLAAAYFLRGWATYLRNPGSPLALADVERAAQLDPAEPLYTQSVVYLKR